MLVTPVACLLGPPDSSSRGTNNNRHGISQDHNLGVFLRIPLKEETPVSTPATSNCQTVGYYLLIPVCHTKVWGLVKENTRGQPRLSISASASACARCSCHHGRVSTGVLGSRV